MRQLRERAVPTRAVVHTPDKVASVEGPGVEAVAADLADLDTVEPALAGCERLLLIAPAGPRIVELDGVAITAAERCGIKRVVKLSAFLAAPEQSVLMPRLHGRSERELEASGIAYTHLRPNWFMQNTLRWAPLVAAEGSFFGSAGAGRVSAIDVRDVAAAAVAVLLQDGHERQTIDLTGPEAAGCPISTSPTRSTRTACWPRVPPNGAPIRLSASTGRSARATTTPCSPMRWSG